MFSFFFGGGVNYADSYHTCVTLTSKICFIVCYQCQFQNKYFQTFRRLGVFSIWGVGSSAFSSNYPSERTITYPTLGKRKIIFKSALGWDMLVFGRVSIGDMFQNSTPSKGEPPTIPIPSVDIHIDMRICRCPNLQVLLQLKDVTTGLVPSWTRRVLA